MSICSQGSGSEEERYTSDWDDVYDEGDDGNGWQGDDEEYVSPLGDTIDMNTKMDTTFEVVEQRKIQKVPTRTYTIHDIFKAEFNTVHR